MKIRNPCVELTIGTIVEIRTKMSYEILPPLKSDWRLVAILELGIFFPNMMHRIIIIYIRSFVEIQAKNKCGLILDGTFNTVQFEEKCGV